MIEILEIVLFARMDRERRSSRTSGGADTETAVAVMRAELYGALVLASDLSFNQLLLSSFPFHLFAL